MKVINGYFKSVCIALTLFTAVLTIAQKPYTQKQYSVDTLLNIPYGTATDFAGNTVTLTLDIYKPIGDTNCRKPLIILVHGGAWVGGSKDEASLVKLGRDMAARGWVAASINYRLGHHKAASYTMYPLCNSSSLSAPCGYICDSAEIYRANFRGMQDAKGAVRFMKMRHWKDSTDTDNVFIAGESAGGFVSLAAAYTDQTGEKHPSCYAISDAPVADPDLAAYNCIPSPINRSRPDLGSIDGDLHTGSPHTAKVRGVGNIFGGVLDTAIFRQSGNDKPAVYMFHQGADIVVNYDYGRLLGRINWECYAPNNICQPYYFTPFAYGSEGIRKHFQNMAAAAPLSQTELVSNYSYMNNCFSNGHAYDNFDLRTQNMCDFFASLIEASGNKPTAVCNTSLKKHEFESANIYPNPSKGLFYIESIFPVLPENIRIFDMQGRAVFVKTYMENGKPCINMKGLTAGNYMLLLEQNGQLISRLICLE